MTTGPVVRTLVVAQATFYRSFAGTAAVALAAAALVYPLLVLAVVRGSPSGTDLLQPTETLFSALFLPVILLLVCLVNAVGLFRTELEEDTLLYPMNRTIPRPALVAGKYLGFAAATLVVLVPSMLVGTSIAAAATSGPTFATVGLLEAIVAMTVLGVLAYGAIFLLLGLWTRHALVLGLLYGFIWETFISVLAGPVRAWTVVYYLRDLGSQLALTGPLGQGPNDVPMATAGALLVAGALVALAIASVHLQLAETRPG